ncbi:MAG: 16S rRNA (adenine(1518)-N(6)/adenine(1519)-N(6))-dimethyltransferase RsmA [Gemmatimonadales bacterium]
MSRPKKALGQHFLADPGILRRIADALEPTPGETVLEIGPGPGGLTAQLAGRGIRLIAIERDRDMVPGLRARFPDVEIVEGDALEENWHRLAAGPFAVIGNIPYNITTPLIDQALRPPRPRRVVFLVQKEVAERVAAAPGGKEYGALTVGVQSVATVERLFKVPAGAFHPAPKVDSAVIRLTPRQPPLVRDDEVAAFRRFVVGLFGFRRKQLGRALRELTGRDAEQAARAVVAAGLTPTSRMETIAPEGFVALFRQGGHAL